MDERGVRLEVFGVESQGDDAGEQDQGCVAKSEGKGERHGRDGRGFVERPLPERGLTSSCFFYWSVRLIDRS